MAVDLRASWARLVGDSQVAVDSWAGLIGRWSEPHRRYHGMGHLTAVLLFVDEYAQHAEDPSAVRLAAWFHDAVYDPRASDNEERSAALAEQELAALGQPGDRVDEVARLVRLTVGHDPIEGDRNGELLNDADLLVLAGPWEAYVAYLNAIRAEYSHVSDADFRAGRILVLEALLSRPKLYRLPAVSTLEEAARRNVAAELNLLRSHPDSAPGDPGGATPPSAGQPGPPGR